MRTIAYVDGFNLYFGALRKTPHRWLNIQRLIELHLMPHCAVIISGDSDLLMPVKIVRNELKKVVGVLNPQRHPCAVLKANATFYKHIRLNFVAASHFPDTLTDARGTFTKPAAWP